MRVLFSLFIIGILPFFVSKKEQPEVHLEPDVKYCNARFHFCTEFPDTLLPTRLVSDNNDGIILRSADNNVVVTIAGSREMMHRDTWDLYDDFVGEWMMDNKDGRIVYEIIEKPYYKVSFIDGDNHYWQQLFHKGNKYIIYQIVTPKKEAYRIDKIREHLQLTFDM